MEAIFYVADTKIIPANDETYELLCSFGSYSTRMSISILPLLKEYFAKKKIEVKTQPIKQLFDSYKQTTQNFWAEKYVEKDENTFILTGKYSQNNKDKLIKLEHQWQKVFNRFGYHGEFKYDETATRLKMTISYEMSDTLPEIKLKTPLDLKSATLRLDDYLITLHTENNKTKLVINVPYDKYPVVSTDISSVYDDGFIIAILSMLK